MRRVKVFSGSSHPLLVEAICERLGTPPAKATLGHFSNGETSVSIDTSIRDQDVFIVQSGSTSINDSLMEMLIMISACKGGSAKTITAVMPYFPYSRQSKKKSHRGAIVARLVANLLSVAGINHVITMDLHAPPTKGFFGKPVDDLHAEPLIARWIKAHVHGWQEAVVVSKNPSGTKRVTSLADALKLSFALVTTERRRAAVSGSVDGSGILDRVTDGIMNLNHGLVDPDTKLTNGFGAEETRTPHRDMQRTSPHPSSTSPTIVPYRHLNNHQDIRSSPLAQSTRVDSASPPTTRIPIQRELITSSPSRSSEVDEDVADEYSDEKARDVITGRIIHGHLVEDDAPSPALSTMSNSIGTLSGDILGQPQLDDRDLMTSSFMSTVSAFQADNALGGSADTTGHSDDEEESFKNPELEHTITLVGNVKDRIVFIVDDLIDQSGSWIAAAETAVKRGDAKMVYCIATHGIFGGDSLEEMNECDCIQHIVVTNSYPIDPERIKASNKLVVLDVSNLLSEAIRRTHHGESISALFQHYPD